MSSVRIIIISNSVEMIARITYNAADVINNIVHLPGGGGQCTQISGDGNDQMAGQQSKPKKFPGPKINPPKNPMPIFPALKISIKL